MASVNERHDLITGQFRFASDVSRERVIDLAQRLKKRDEDNRIRTLIVRGCGPKTYAIMFVVEFDGTQKTYKKIVYTETDKLLREFGRSVNWDITNENYPIE